MWVSLYQLHSCVWDSMRAGEVSSGPAPVFDVTRYDLTDDERTAFENRDVAALYQLGLHPVLLNGFCRVAGYSLSTYRGMLQPLAAKDERSARWQK
jgi:hypothetical protein